MFSLAFSYVFIPFLTYICSVNGNDVIAFKTYKQNETDKTSYRNQQLRTATKTKLTTPQDKTSRDIYKCTIFTSLGQYTFTFGQSIINSGIHPTAYDVLSAIEKNDPEDFDNFCGNYEYDTDSRTAERVYKAVCKQWKAISRIYSAEQIEQLKEIQ